GGVLKYSALYLVGKTPPTQPFIHGCGVAILSSASDHCSIYQRRKAFGFGLNKQQTNAGLGKPEQRARWAIPVYGHPLVDREQNQSRQDKDTMSDGHGHDRDRGAQGHAWKAYWVPFQDQFCNAKDDARQQEGSQKQQQEGRAKVDDVSMVKVGEGCDLVVLYTHGRGFIDGHPLQSLDMFRRIMKYAQQEHNVKAWILVH
ncbi:hypothetical protein BGZ65_005733, partial [Modicella reniformis]